jgi:subtilisin family serine protease
MSGSPGNLCKEYGFLSVGCLETTRLDERACYSNYGPKVNAVAHGHQILASVYHQAGTGIATSGAIDSDFEWFTPSNPNNALVDYTYFNGTSSATPFSVGICALIGSANMDLTGLQICQIAKDTWDKPQNPDFTTLFPELPGIWNAGKAVSKALSLVPEFAGHIFPYCNFFKRDIMGRYIPILISDAVVWSSGVPTVHLHGTIYVELIAYSSDPITSLELWAGSTMVYQGGARTTWDSLIPLNSGLLAGNLLKLVARTSTLTVEQEYVDVIGHTSAAAAPLTTVSWPTATRGTIILSSVSENAPVTIRYRWGSGAWSTYLAPLTPQSGKLQFYGIDISGNIEGGVYDPV